MKTYANCPPGIDLQDWLSAPSLYDDALADPLLAKRLLESIPLRGQHPRRATALAPGDWERDENGGIWTWVDQNIGWVKRL